jgi:secondary thiamine-phosphate synthase enzyme
MSTIETIDIRTTTREEMIDITQLVRSAIRKSGTQNGLVCVFVPHTTAAITLQENTDPNVKTDMLAQLGKVVPRDAGFTNAEENTDAHIKSSIVGATATLIVDAGKPVLGHWQALFFCEFDGPRQRKVHVRAIG